MRFAQYTHYFSGAKDTANKIWMAIQQCFRARDLTGGVIDLHTCKV